MKNFLSNGSPPDAFGIQVKRFSKTYDGRRKVVDNLFLDVRWGEIVGLLGPNGCGKTTTLTTITGILPPTEGKILVAGADIVQDPMTAKQQTGYVPDGMDVVDNLTGWEYVCLTAALYGYSSDTIQNRVAALFQMFALDAFQHKLVGTYSHGMLKKVQLIATLAHEPQLLVLDEPTSGLDVESTLLLKGMLKKLKSRGRAIFLASHQLSMVEKLCDRVYLMSDGKCLATGSPRQIIGANEADSLEEAFIKLTIGHSRIEDVLDEVLDSM